MGTSAVASMFAQMRRIIIRQQDPMSQQMLQERRETIITNRRELERQIEDSYYAAPAVISFREIMSTIEFERLRPNPDIVQPPGGRPAVEAIFYRWLNTELNSEQYHALRNEMLALFPQTVVNPELLQLFANAHTYYNTEGGERDNRELLEERRRLLREIVGD